jgi:hypothetical protein
VLVLLVGLALSAPVGAVGLWVEGRDIEVSTCAAGGCERSPAPFREDIVESSLVVERGDAGWWLGPGFLVGALALAAAMVAWLVDPAGRDVAAPDDPRRYETVVRVVTLLGLVLAALWTLTLGVLFALWL